MNLTSTRCECREVTNFGLNSSQPIVFTLECDKHRKNQDCDTRVYNGSGSMKTIECMEHTRW